MEYPTSRSKAASWQWHHLQHGQPDWTMSGNFKNHFAWLFPKNKWVDVEIELVFKVNKFPMTGTDVVWEVAGGGAGFLIEVHSTRYVRV